MDSAASEITFDDVVEKSKNVEEFNANVRKYLKQHKELTKEEKRKFDVETLVVNVIMRM